MSWIDYSKLLEIEKKVNSIFDATQYDSLFSAGRLSNYNPQTQTLLDVTGEGYFDKIFIQTDNSSLQCELKITVDGVLTYSGSYSDYSASLGVILNKLTNHTGSEQYPYIGSGNKLCIISAPIRFYQSLKVETVFGGGPLPARLNYWITGGVKTA